MQNRTVDKEAKWGRQRGGRSLSLPYRARCEATLWCISASSESACLCEALQYQVQLVTLDRLEVRGRLALPDVEVFQHTLICLTECQRFSPSKTNNDAATNINSIRKDPRQMYELVCTLLSIHRRDTSDRLNSKLYEDPPKMQELVCTVCLVHTVANADVRCGLLWFDV